MELVFLFVIGGVVLASWKRWAASTPEPPLPISPPPPPPADSGPSIWDQQ